MININKEILKNLKPCADRWKNYLDHYETFSGSFAEFLFLDKITIADKIFVIKKIVPTKYLVKWAQACAESVAHLKNSSTTTTKNMLSIFRIDETFLIKEAAHEIFL